MHQKEHLGIVHFTLLCWVTWPLRRGEAWCDLDLIQTSLSCSCKCRLVSIRTTWFTWEKQWDLYQNKVSPSLLCIHRAGHLTHNKTLTNQRIILAKCEGPTCTRHCMVGFEISNTFVCNLHTQTIIWSVHKLQTNIYTWHAYLNKDP